MDKERRMVEHECRVEDRAGGGHKITGYAAVFGSRTDLGTFSEEIEPGAFADALETSDVRGLFNHDPNLVLGRTVSGTLRLMEDEHGLRYDLDVPETRTGTELVALIKRGDISGNSFSFTVGEDKWEAAEAESDGPPKMHRRVVRVERLFDVGPVTYPAYEATTVSARSLERVEAEADKIARRSDEAVEHIKRIHEMRRKRLALLDRAS